MGRKRTTGCQLSHTPGERCILCERRRAQRTRARKRASATKSKRRGSSIFTPPIRTPERLAMDAEAAKRRRTRQNALRYVAQYLKRGALVPPSGCEQCGVSSFSPWHPNPEYKTLIAWLCRPCKNYAQHSGEDIELTWSWPGHDLPLRSGRPPRVSLPSQALHDLSQATAPLRDRLGPAGEVIFFSKLKLLMGPERSEELIRQGLRALHQGLTWSPVEDPIMNELLCRCILHEQDAHTTDASHWVESAPLWERRSRIDREVLQPTVPSHSRSNSQIAPAVDVKRYAKEWEKALAKLDAAVESANAILAKYGL